MDEIIDYLRKQEQSQFHDIRLYLSHQNRQLKLSEWGLFALHAPVCPLKKRQTHYDGKQRAFMKAITISKMI